MAQHFLARRIIDTIRTLPGYPKCRVLDLSCGRGEILAALKRDGCEVRWAAFAGDAGE
jgi:2-polyprenyl-3-methyl-5-hydroxy-6-metoxy-1,4-benzoquinol methylase